MTKAKMFEPLTTEEKTAADPPDGNPPEEDPGFQAILPPPPEAGAPPGLHPTLGRATAVYEYKGRNRQLLFRILRFDLKDGDKTIRPQTYGHSKGTTGWQWRFPPSPRSLYGLDKLVERPSAPVVVVEGEKASEAARQLFVDTVVITSARGAKAAKETAWSPLSGRRVFIWPDADDDGLAYASQVAELALQSGALEVRVLDLQKVKTQISRGAGVDQSDLAKGWDAADALAEGMTAEQGERLLNDETNWQPVDPPVGAGDTPSATGLPDDLTQREKLIVIGMEAELFRDEDHCAYATVKVDNHHENHRLRSRRFRLWLLSEYGRNHPVLMQNGTQRPGAPSSQAITEALSALEAIALGGAVFQASVRVATAADRVYVDLGGTDWSAVEIDGRGWKVVSKPPVKFLRPAGLRPLPTPQAGGDLVALRDFVNVATEDDFKLILGWLLAAFSPGGPYPVLVVNGEQGSAKTTLCRVLRRLIDPNQAEVRPAPRDERDLFIACNNSHIIVFDNLSHTSTGLADGMCRVATGAGFATRTLFTDTDETIIRACQPQIINGIPDLATRSDLADRAIVLTLPAISDDKRCTEQEFWERFERKAPDILGALFDGISCALLRRREVHLSSKPRMADFARWVEAAAPAFGWEPGEFLAVYEGNRANAVSATLEADVVAEAILELVASKGRWAGTASELLAELETQVSEQVRRQRAWPKSASSLSGRLKRAAPNLRSVGVELFFDRSGARREVRIDKAPETPSLPSSPSLAGTKLLKTNLGNGDADVTADDAAGDNAVMVKSLKIHPYDGDDAGDGELQPHSKWETVV
jgi:5S rRNA maturation endonuclease (ribonuclease M5)